MNSPYYPVWGPVRDKGPLSIANMVHMAKVHERDELTENSPGVRSVSDCLEVLSELDPKEIASFKGNFFNIKLMERGVNGEKKLFWYLVRSKYKKNEKKIRSKKAPIEIRPMIDFCLN